MDANRDSEPKPMTNRATVERRSERELVVTRTISGPARLVFEAWTQPELFKRWWVPKAAPITRRPLGRAAHVKMIWAPSESSKKSPAVITSLTSGRRPFRSTFIISMASSHA